MCECMSSGCCRHVLPSDDVLVTAVLPVSFSPTGVRGGNRGAATQEGLWESPHRLLRMQQQGWQQEQGWQDWQQGWQQQGWQDGQQGLHQQGWHNDSQGWYGGQQGWQQQQQHQQQQQQQQQEQQQVHWQQVAAVAGSSAPWAYGSANGWGAPQSNGTADYSGYSPIMYHNYQSGQACGGHNCGSGWHGGEERQVANGHWECEPDGAQEPEQQPARKRSRWSPECGTGAVAEDGGGGGGTNHSQGDGQPGPRRKALMSCAAAPVAPPEVKGAGAEAQASKGGSRGFANGWADRGGRGRGQGRGGGGSHWQVVQQLMAIYADPKSTVPYDEVYDRSSPPHDAAVATVSPPGADGELAPAAANDVPSMANDSETQPAPASPAPAAAPPAAAAPVLGAGDPDAATTAAEDPSTAATTAAGTSSTPAASPASDPGVTPGPAIDSQVISTPGHGTDPRVTPAPSRATDPRVILLFDLNGTLTSHTSVRKASGITRLRPGVQHLVELKQHYR